MLTRMLLPWWWHPFVGKVPVSGTRSENRSVSRRSRGVRRSLERAEQVDELTSSLTHAKGGLHAHPDNASDGNLAKEWVARDGMRMLRKGGLRNNQEPFNEVVATALHKRLLGKGSYVAHELDEGSSPIFSLCPNFLTDEEEYIPAMYVMRAFEQGSSISDFDHYLECCSRLGVEDTRGALERRAARMIDIAEWS